MASHSTDTLPTEALFFYLSDVPLVATTSDEMHSGYLFQCGCLATRKASGQNVRVTWCSKHGVSPSASLSCDA
jgi:hypothetical protein